MVALEVKQQEIPFAAGVDEADDPQGAPAGFLRAVNVVWNKDTVPEKRGAFVFQRHNADANNVALVASGTQLGIVRTDGIQAASDVDTTLPLNPAPFTGTDSLGTYYTGRSVVATDSAAITNASGQRVICLVLTTYDIATFGSSYGVFAVFIDAATGATLQQTMVASENAHGRVTVVYNPDLAADVFFVTCVYTGGAIVTFRTYEADTFTEVDQGPLTGVEIQEFGDMACTDLVQSIVDPTRVIYSWLKPSDSNIGVVEVSYDGTIEATMAFLCKLTGATPALAQIDGFVCLACRVGTAPQVLMLTPGTLDAVGSWAVPNASGLSIFNVTMLAFSPSEIIYVRILNAVSSQGTYHSEVWLLSEPVAETVEYAGVLRNTYVSTRPWQDSIGRVYAMGFPGNAPNQQGDFGTGMILNLPTTALDPANIPAPVVGQICYDECGRIELGVRLSSAQITSVTTDDNETVFVPAVVLLGPAAAYDDAPLNRARISRVRFSRALDVPTTLQIDGVGYVPGSSPMLFDGFAGTSMAFFETPTSPRATAVNVGTGALTGTFQYRVVWEAYDSSGNLRISMPSQPRTIEVTNSNVQVSVQMPENGLRFVSDLRWRGAWRAKIYRASTAATTFHLVWSSVPGNLWDASEPFGFDSFVDNLTDVQIADAEILQYTDGNILSSEPAPPIAFVWAHRNRLFAIRADTPETVPYTKEITAPNLPEWNAVLSFRVDNSGGPPYAGASIQDKCLVFQRDQVVVVSGLGPDATGAPPVGAFSQPEVVVLGHGTIEPSSVVQTPQGIMFRHSTGYKMLEPSMQVVEVGRAIEDTLRGRRIVRARYLPRLHQVWVLPDWDEFEVLVFDVRYSRWSVFRNTVDGPGVPPLLDVLEVDQRIWALSADSLFEYLPDETRDVVIDGELVEVDYDMELLTPWIRGDRAQLVRCYKVHFTGTAQNFDGAAVDLYAYTQRARVKDHDSEDWDAQYHWDAETLQTTPSGAFALTARLITQRCEAFRIGLVLRGPWKVCRPATLTVDFGVIETSRGKTPVGKRPVPST